VIVADTDVLIDALSGTGALERVRDEIRAGRLATTVVSVFELHAATEDEGHRSRVEDLLAAVRILPLEAGAVRRAASVRRSLAAQGVELTVPASLVAGLCLEHDAPLLTSDREAFERIEALRLA
jgi:predicted nucleic acid-binding protein